MSALRKAVENEEEVSHKISEYDFQENVSRCR